MNFNVIDGNDDYLQKLPEFVYEYNRGYLSVPKIIEKLDITRGEYRKLRRTSLEEGLITLKRKGNKKKETYKTNPKYYGKTVTKGRVYWKVYYKNQYLCLCKTKQQAETIVERLKKVNWDLRYLNNIKEEVMEST